MKNFFAWMQIVFAIVLAFVAVIGYLKLKSTNLDKQMEAFAKAADSYKQVVISSKSVFEQSYNTIPQHKRTLETARDKIDDLKKACDTTEQYIRDSKWLPKSWKWVQKMQQLPQEIYQPCGELKKSFELSINVLESLDENKKQEFLIAFENTIQAMNQASQVCRQADSHFNTNAFYFLLLVLLISLCFMANGIAILLIKNVNL